MAAVRTLQRVFFGKTVIIGREQSLTYLAQDLTFRTIVAIKVDGRSLALRAGTVFRDTGFRATIHRFDFLVITLVIVVDEIFPVPVLSMMDNDGKFINLELLILGRMGIVESPLFERDISTDKI